MCAHLCEDIRCQLRKVLTCSRLLPTCVYLCEQSFGFHFRTDIELFPGPINLRFKQYLCEKYWISLQKRLCFVPGAYFMRLSMRETIACRFRKVFALLWTPVGLCSPLRTNIGFHSRQVFALFRVPIYLRLPKRKFV